MKLVFQFSFLIQYVIEIFQSEVSTYGFETPRKSACRHLWRCCVEHHAFFRLVRVAPMPQQEGTGELFSLGSRFRYRYVPYLYMNSKI